jgi:hypothetical protein
MALPFSPCGYPDRFWTMKADRGKGVGTGHLLLALLVEEGP